MYLSKFQRARISAVRRGASFEDLPTPHAHTIVNADKYQVVTWDEQGDPVVGLAMVAVNGLPYVAYDYTSKTLRADIASVLGVEPLVIEGITRPFHTQSDCGG